MAWGGDLLGSSDVPRSPEAQKAAEKKKVELSLGALKSNVEQQTYASLIEAIDVGGLDNQRLKLPLFVGENFGQMINQDNLKAVSDVVAAKTVLKPASYDVFAAILKQMTGEQPEKEELEGLADTVFSYRLLFDLQKKLQEKYPKMSEFVAANPAVKPPVDQEIVLGVTNGKVEIKDISFPADVGAVFESAYQKFTGELAQKEATVATGAGASAAEVEGELSADEKAQQRAADLAEINSKLPFVKMFDDPKGKSMAESILDGEAPLFAFIAGMLGVGCCSEAFESIFDMLPEKMQGAVLKLQKKGKELMKNKELLKLVNKMAKEAKQMNMSEVMAAGAEISIQEEKGVKLNEDFASESFGARLRIDLTEEGAMVVLPKGDNKTTYQISEAEGAPGEKAFLAAEPKVFEKKVLFVDELPVGTFFSKGVKVKKLVA